MGGEPRRTEARLDFVGVERGELAEGREAEGAQRFREIVVQVEQADRAGREKGGVAAARDDGGQADGRTGVRMSKGRGIGGDRGVRDADAGGPETQLLR